MSFLHEISVRKNYLTLSLKNISYVKKIDVRFDIISVNLDSFANIIIYPLVHSGLPEAFF